jgi:hypothetical protein
MDGWINNKFWEELIVYFPFSTVWIFDTGRKETLVCMRNEVSKTIQFERLQWWCYEWERSMKYTIEMASNGLTYMPSFMEMGTSLQAILRFCLRVRNRTWSCGICGGTKWRWGRFSPRSSVSPAIFVRFTNYSTITLMYHPGNAQ